LYFEILTESSSFFLNPDVLILGVFQTVKVRLKEDLLFNEVGILEIRTTALIKHALLVVHGAALGLVFLVDALLPGEMI
jgi:hypothetical protein